MRHFLSVLPFLISTLSFGQQSEYRPFKMIIISPDTAIIDEELKLFPDTIESDYVKRYYNSIKQIEDFLDHTDDKKMRKEYEEKLKFAKQSEIEIKKFKYFETIPVYSSSVLQMYFNEYPPNSTFQVVRTKDLKSKNLKEIAEAYQADYVVKYTGVYTVNFHNGVIAMNLMTILFSSKDSQILFEKRSVGNMNSYGDMWTCSNPLSCLLITSVKSSTTEIYDTVSKRQKK
jgi:hypothetical protein